MPNKKMFMGKWRLFSSILMFGLVFGGLLAVGVAVAFHLSPPVPLSTHFNKNLISEMMSERGGIQEFPTETEIMVGNILTRARVQYTFNLNLQSHMENLIKTYRPDYAAFVAIDPVTGQVISMVSYLQNNKKATDHLVLRATFPAASIFKVVTAAAAIAERNFSSHTVIPFTGRNHTLYRSNVLKSPRNRWIRHMTLKDAFAKSVNTVFGKIGVFEVGPSSLQAYADRFGFNRKIASDIPVQAGKAIIPQDPWELAESASGFTKSTTMSPLQGALIAAAIVNDGIMMAPYVVEAVYSMEGNPIYQAQPNVAHLSVDAQTAREIRSLMRETIRRGTSRKAFRGFFKGPFAEMDVGGKTGSLSGTDPRGKYDWFIGYSHLGGRPLAIAVLTIHEKYWRVKSSYLARKAFERYYTHSR